MPKRRLLTTKPTIDPSAKKCLNSYGGCNNPTVELEFSDGFKVTTTTNFCSHTCRLLYKGERTLRSGIKRSRVEDPKQMIVSTKEFTYIWDTKGKKYCLYKPGIGMLDDHDRIVAPDGGPYVSGIIKKKKIHNREVKKGIKLPKGYYQCQTCGKLLRVFGPQDDLPCPLCGWFISRCHPNNYKKRLNVKQFENMRKLIINKTSVGERKKI